MKETRAPSPTHTESWTIRHPYYCPDRETQAQQETVTVPGHPAEPGLTPSLRPPCLAVPTTSQLAQQVPCHCPGLVSLMRALGGPDERQLGRAGVIICPNDGDSGSGQRLAQLSAPSSPCPDLRAMGH